MLVFAWSPLPRSAQSVTYTKDIAPLLADRCGMCHHPGGSAPFSLADLRGCEAPRDADRRRDEEPLHAAVEGRSRRTVRSSASIRSSDAEIALIARWVDGGAAEGDPRDLPPPRVWSEGWQLGTPDLVVTLPQAYTLPAEGSDVFRIFTLPIPVETARFVRGLEFRPGNPKVVHHANIRIDRDARVAPSRRAGSGAGLRRADRAVGDLSGRTFPRAGRRGRSRRCCRSDLAWRLDRGTDLVVELHMQPSGKPELVAPSIGLYFGEAGPDADAGDAAARPAEHRHPRRRRRATRSPIPTCCRWTSRCRRCSRTRTTALRDVRGEATLPDGSTQAADRDQGLGLPLAARLPLRDAAAAAEGDDAVDALRLRQLRGEPAQSGAAAGARALGAAVVGRDGRPLDSGADARRRRSGALEPGLPAEGGRGRRARLRSRDREASGRYRPARRCGAAVSRAGARRRSDRALQDVAGAEAAVRGGALQPRHGADGRAAAGRGRRSVPRGAADRSGVRERAQQPRQRLPGGGQVRRRDPRVQRGGAAAAGVGGGVEESRGRLRDGRAVRPRRRHRRRRAEPEARPSRWRARSARSARSTSNSDDSRKASRGSGCLRGVAAEPTRQRVTTDTTASSPAASPGSARPASARERRRWCSPSRRARRA